MIRRLSSAFVALVSALVLVGAVQAPASAAVELTAWGPAYVTQSGTYRYYARLGAPYNWFQWSSRVCPTSSISSCTSMWSPRSGFNDGVNTAYSDIYVPRDCTGGGTKTTQVRVVAGAFGVPAQTKYVVTKECYELP